MFKQYIGPMMGLPRNENYLVFRWDNEDCNILFSVCRMGNAANCHFASDKKGKKFIKEAINKWCDFVFDIFDWCEMVTGVVKDKKIGKLIEKCNFEHVTDLEEVSIYMRAK